MKKIGFIGMGNMAKAMAIGFISSGKVQAADMGAFAPNQEKLAKNAAEEAAEAAKLAEAVEEAAEAMADLLDNHDMPVEPRA